MIEKSDCSRDFSKEITKKYRDTHKKSEIVMNFIIRWILQRSLFISR